MRNRSASFSAAQNQSTQAGNHSQDWLPSGKSRPCPVCGRTSDGDCRISSDGERVICHHPKDYTPGRDVVNGYAFTGNTSDGRAGHFTIDKPRDGSAARASKVVPLPVRPAAAPLPDPATITLARLPGPQKKPPEHWANGQKLPYGSDNRQWVEVVVAGDGSKRHIPHHKDADGKAIAKAGPEPWPLWCDNWALEHGPGQWVAEAEGEKCAAWFHAAAVVAVSQPGHDHKPASIQRRYGELVAAGVAGVVYLADNDQGGDRKARKCAAAAAAVGLPFLSVRSADVWPIEMPAGGSIDDAWGTAAERVAQFEQHIRSLKPEQPEDETKPASSAAPGGRRVRLAPDDVLARLPQVLGEIRQNIRTGDVMTSKAGPLTGNEISRLYLELSSVAETWPKDVTGDAVMLLASRNSYDPAAEYLDTITAEPLPMAEWERLDKHLLDIDDPIAARFLPRYLISAVARTMEPGCYVRQIPVLVGPQERGKSELGRILFGADQWVEGVGKLDRDALQRAHTAWGVELAELDGVTRRRDQEHLKAFLTETCDTYQIRYDRHPERHPRRFVFWGTANRPPLRDSTGSTRFVIIPILDQMLPLDWAREHRDALWARALEQYRSGVTWLRTDEQERQEVEARNADFIERDPWADDVAQVLAGRQTSDTLPVRVPEILQALGVPVERRTNDAAKRVTTIAELLGWRHGRRNVDGFDAKGKRSKVKAQGLWPPGRPGHPGHPEDTPGGVQPNGSNANGSQQPDTPDTSISEKGEIKGEEQQGTAASDARKPESRSRDGFSGCPGCPPHQTDCSATDLLDTAGVSVGVSVGVSRGVQAPTWLPELLQLRAQHPHHLPVQLANLLQSEHSIPTDGRKVKETLQAWDAQQSGAADLPDPWQP